MEEVVSTCQNNPECEYDYIMTGKKEIGLTTLRRQKQFMALQKTGSKQCEYIKLDESPISNSNIFSNILRSTPEKRRSY